MKKHLLIADSISAVILLLLVYAAFSKLADYATFKFSLERSPLLRPFAPAIALLLPAVEITIAVLLFIPSTRPKGLYGSLYLISVFTVYLAAMLLFSTSLPCNCGGVLTSLSWPQHILFNCFFMLLSAAGILLYKKHLQSIKRTPP